MKRMNLMMVALGLAGALWGSVPMSKEPTKDVQAALDQVFPGWVTSENAPNVAPGLRLPPYANGAKVPSVMTHPLKEGFAVLSRELTVPVDVPRLFVSASAHWRSVWRR